MYTMYLLMWLKKSWRGIKGIKYYTQKWNDCLVLCRLVSFFSASKTAETSSSTNCICHYFFVAGGDYFPLSFLWIFCFSPGRDILWTTSPTLFVIRFIKSTFTTMFTITGITSIVITFIVSFTKGQWWQKGIYSCPLKVISDASLSILCTAFLQKLYCARVSHGMVRLVKWDIWVFWWNQPYYWKRRQLQYPTTLLGDVGILMLLVC